MADAAMVKVFCSEMLGRVADHTVQIYGGMGLMEELPVQRLWRDSRLERIWDGTSEIQRHIVTPLGSPAPWRMTPKRRANFQRLLKPRHIAVIGGRDAEVVAGECARIGYDGPFWPVNPRREKNRRAPLLRLGG